jgi:hypothetical protein
MGLDKESHRYSRDAVKEERGLARALHNQDVRKEAYVMSQIAIWLDRNMAKVFHFTNNQLRASSTRKDSAGNVLFRELAQDVGDADVLLILGPGVAKHHFYNHLAEHHPVVAKKIIGCEYADLATDGQISSRALERFASRESA